MPDSFALIGEIIRAADSDPEVSSGRDVRWWDRAQAVFGTRLDYLLWRQHWCCGPDFAGPAPDWADIAVRIADEKIHTNAWGLLVLAPSLIKRATDEDPDEGESLARAVLKKSADLSGLESAPVGCAVARFLAESAAHAALETGREPSTASLGATIQRIRAGLRSINPAWHPHVHPEVQAMADESMLLPMSTAGVLGHIYAVLREVTVRGGEVARREPKLHSAMWMHHRLALTAITAWRCQFIRGQLSSAAGRAKHGEFIAADGWLASDYAGAQEQFFGLLGIAHEYFNGADLFKAANFAHLAFRMVPEADEPSWRAADFWSRWIHQVGLEIDGRFRKEIVWEPGAEKLGNHLGKDARVESTFWRWVRAQQKQNPDWRLLLDACPQWKHLIPELVQEWASGSPTDEMPLRLLTFLAHRVTEIEGPELRTALFRLCLSYSLASLAATVVVTLPPGDRDSTMQFARAILRMQTAMPVGFDEGQHEKFREAIRTRFAAHAAAGQEIGAEDAFTVHELLLGRSLVHLRSMPTMVSSNLTAKFHGMITDEQVRRLLARGRLSGRRGVGIVGSEVFEKFAAEYRHQVGGKVFFLTIVRLGGDRFSIFGSNGTRRAHTFLSISKFEARLKALRETMAVPVQSPSFNVPWGGEFLAFARSLGEFAVRCGAGQASMAMAATEPELAGIPWQDLFRRGMVGDTYPIVSLVPSLTWASLAWRRSFVKPPEWLRVVSSKADSFAGERFKPLRQTLYRMNQFRGRLWNGVAFIAGHGLLDGQGCPVVEGCGKHGTLLQERGWLEYGGYHVLVLHVCMGGQMQPGFLGDLGGVPALVLGMNCRIVCAPVSEVGVDTALVLQTCLTDPDAPRPFWQRYADALKKDPKVGCYNLYGFGVEWIEKPNLKVV